MKLTMKATGFTKVDEQEAKFIQAIYTAGLNKVTISNLYGYKYMDVVNVLRGNSFSWVTGILGKGISKDEIITVKKLIQAGRAYRDLARYSKIEANRVRNIMGYLQFNRFKITAQ